MINLLLLRFKEYFMKSKVNFIITKYSNFINAAFKMAELIWEYHDLKNEILFTANENLIFNLILMMEKLLFLYLLKYVFGISRYMFLSSYPLNFHNLYLNSLQPFSLLKTYILLFL
jgi:hypothetical protein